MHNLDMMVDEDGVAFDPIGFPAPEEQGVEEEDGWEEEE